MVGWTDTEAHNFSAETSDPPGWLDGVQLALGALGMAPVVGEVFDLADAGISYARGDYPGASLSMAAAIPGIGNVAGAGKLANRLNKLTKKVSGGTANSAQGALLKEHLRQSQKYGKGSIRELSDGRYRYYDKLKPPKKAGEMAGQRKVREWDPVTGNKRTWFETLDHSGNVRQVRPEFNTGSKSHYMFDKKGNYIKRW